MSNPVGRPRTKVSDLPADWKEIILDRAQDGGSAVEAQCALGISRKAWDTLIKDSEEFKTTVKQSAQLCQNWWEANGRRLAVEGGGNATIWIFNMKNRFGWHDKQQVDHQSSDGSMTPTKIERVIIDSKDS